MLYHIQSKTWKLGHFRWSGFFSYQQTGTICDGINYLHVPSDRNCLDNPSIFSKSNLINCGFFNILQCAECIVTGLNIRSVSQTSVRDFRQYVSSRLIQQSRVTECNSLLCLKPKQIRNQQYWVTRQVRNPKKLTKGCVKLFSPDSCLHEPSFRNKRYGILNFGFNFKMAAINQNGGQNVTIVNISAVISPILMTFQAFVIFPRSRKSNLILCSILEFNMAAKIQNGCQKVIKFYILVIKLSVYEFLQ